MGNCWFCYREAGALEYHPKCSMKFFGTTEVPVLKLDEKILRELAEKTVNRRIAVTGVQPKLSVTLEKVKGKSRLTIVGLWGEYILKPQHAGFPLMPETEDLTMHLAELFKIPVCGHTLIKATDGSMVYLARRFDREGEKKVHVEDLCQLSEFLTENKYKGSYEKAGKLVIKYCNKGIDTLNYFELVLFSFLSGNNDMHLKNFSLIHREKEISLSPAYDLLNVNLLNPKDDEELALTLNGKKKKLKLNDFILLAQALGIPEKAYLNAFKRFTAQNDAVSATIKRSFLEEKQKKMYNRIWLDKQAVFEVT